jgi:AraC-like DNA-binding protein
MIYTSLKASSSCLFTTKLMFLSNPVEFSKSENILPLAVRLLERLQDAALLIDTWGHFTYGNPSACKLLNCSVKELLAMTVQDLPLAKFSQIWSAQHNRASQSFCFTDRYSQPTVGELLVEITMSYEQDLDRAYSCLLIHQLDSVPHINTDSLEESILPNVPHLEGVFRFIEENYARSISLKDVASAMGYCPSYLTDLVHRCTGQTVNYWIIKRRIVLACSLLKKTDLTINQIAADTGYQNEGHFFRQFRQHCGTTPLAWRKSQQVGGLL